MKKIMILILIVILTLAMAACGGSSDGGAAEADSKNDMSYNGFGGSFVSDQEAAVTEEGYDVSSDEPADGGSGEEGGANISVGLTGSFSKKDVKLIYTANIGIETLDFDEAVKGLHKLTDKFGGYFESVTSDNGSYYSDGSYRYGNYTVRVPSDKYQEFINSISDGMHVVNMSQNAEDIGQIYFDTERRVETLKNKHDRLEELLKQAKKMSDIIELEGALSDTEYELDQYTSELKRYDSLVSYSTVYVSIEQVSDYTEGIDEELTFGQRVIRSVESGFADFGGWLEGLIVWIGYHLIQLLILAAIVIAVVKSRVLAKAGGTLGRKKRKEISVNKEEPEKKDQ